MSKFTIIDDQDLTAVTYTGAWVAGGSAHEHAGTVTSSTTAGNHFSVAFTGSAIGVYGTFDASSAGVVTTYVIDSGVAATVTSPSSALDSYGQDVFSSFDIVSSKLIVTMKSVNAGTDGEGTIWFDYFNVTTGASVPISPSASSSATPTSASSSPVHAKGSSTGSTTSARASSTSAGAGTAVVATKSSHAGLIGGIIGALVVLALIAAAVFYQRKRRATSRYANFPPGQDLAAPANGPAPTQPFLQQAPTTAMGGAPPVGYSPGGFDSRLAYAAGGAAMQGHSGQAYPPPQGAAYDPYASMHTAPQSSYAASSAPSSQYASPHRGALSVVGDTNTEYYSDSVADLKRRQQQVVNSYEQGVSGGSSHGTPPLIQHVDSGVRALDPVGPAPIELPPTYTPN